MSTKSAPFLVPYLVWEKKRFLFFIFQIKKYITLTVLFQINDEPSREAPTGAVLTSDSKDARNQGLWNEQRAWSRAPRF